MIQQLMAFQRGYHKSAELLDKRNRSVATDDDGSQVTKSMVGVFSNVKVEVCLR